MTGIDTLNAALRAQHLIATLPAETTQRDLIDIANLLSAVDCDTAGQYRRLSATDRNANLAASINSAEDQLRLLVEDHGEQTAQIIAGPWNDLTTGGTA